MIHALHDIMLCKNPIVYEKFERMIKIWCSLLALWLWLTLYFCTFHSFTVTLLDSMSAPGDLGWEAYPPEGVSTCEVCTAEIHQSTKKKQWLRSLCLWKLPWAFLTVPFAKDFTRKQFDMEATVTGFGISANSFLTKGYLSFFKVSTSNKRNLQNNSSN